MANPKILEAVQSLSEDERKEFPLFLKSPFFLRTDVSEEMLRLYGCVLEAVEGRSEALSDKGKLHAAVFPEKAYSEVRLERAFTKFVQLTEQFLVVKNYTQEGNKLRRAIDLVGIYRRKRLISLYEKNLQRIKKASTETLRESTDNYFVRYQIAREEYEWLTTFNKAKGDLAVPEVIASLDFYYYTNRLEVLNSYLLQEKIAALDSKEVPKFTSSAPNALSHLEKNYALFVIYKKINDLLLMNEPNRAGFEELLDLIQGRESDFDEETVKMFYAYARNFCSILFDGAMLTFLTHCIR